MLCFSPSADAQCMHEGVGASLAIGKAPWACTYISISIHWHCFGSGLHACQHPTRDKSQQSEGKKQNYLTVMSSSNPWEHPASSRETAVTPSPSDSAGSSQYSADMDDSTSALNKRAEGDVAWTPSRQVKMVLAGQAFCVFIVSLDMTILTATLPVCCLLPLRENVEYC